MKRIRLLASANALAMIVMIGGMHASSAGASTLRQDNVPNTSCRSSVTIAVKDGSFKVEKLSRYIKVSSLNNHKKITWSQEFLNSALNRCIKNVRITGASVVNGHLKVDMLVTLGNNVSYSVYGIVM